MSEALLAVLMVSGFAAIGVALSIYFMRRLGIAANLTRSQRRILAVLLVATVAASTVSALLISSGRPGLGIALLVIAFVVPSWVSTMRSMRQARMRRWPMDRERVSPWLTCTFRTWSRMARSPATP